MTPNQLRQKYLDFFQSRHHAVLPSASIVPENDPTTLFTGSGMQPMVPYLLGEKHPLGTRIVDAQRCFRAEDIEEVGDNRHTTFFEMLGNWSLGDYFKPEQLRWIFEFVTKEVGLDPERLYVTVFAGSPEIGIGEDAESVEIWKQLFKEIGIEAKDVKDSSTNGMRDGRIFYYEDKKNWWSRAGIPATMPIGEPGGPDSEMFFDFGTHLKLHETSMFQDKPCHVNCDCGRFVEICNSVFMQYQRTQEGFESLPQKNVDFGGGFERLVASENGDPDVFLTDLFQPLIQQLEVISGQTYTSSEATKRSFRVIADHVRAAVMLALDGVEPSNKEQGYFARRLLRRSMRFAKMIGIDKPFLSQLIPMVVELYREPYPQLIPKESEIVQVIEQEEQKFAKTLDKGLREFEKLILQDSISGEKAFYLYETFGLPIEIIEEMAHEKQLTVDRAGFDRAKKAHADQSRTLSAGKFKGGLQDHSAIITKFHTATHLLHQALRQVLGTHVSQAGSNITAERLRFDFTHPQKLTSEQVQNVEQLVNAQIQADLPVSMQTMPLTEALSTGALAFFGERYGDKVNVYSIGTFSKEVCGGPHVERTGVLGVFTLGKQESIGSGKRRIYGHLVNESPS